MKYSFRAFSMKNINQSDQVVIWIKGPILFRPAKGKFKIIFPWNVNKIKIGDISLLPIKFWGFRGRQILHLEDVSFDVVKCYTDIKWSTITNQIFMDSNKVESIIEGLNMDIPNSIEILNEIKENTKINYLIPELMDTTKDIIPQTILISKT